MCDMLTTMVLHCLHFLLFQKVSSISHDTTTDNTYLLTADHEHKDSEELCKFWHSLFHALLNQILQPLQLYMEKPEVVCYGDGHYH